MLTAADCTQSKRGVAMERRADSDWIGEIDASDARFH